MSKNYRINGLKYTRRFNLGNYEHEEISVDVAVEEGADAGSALGEAMDFVLSKGKVVNKQSPTPVAANEPTVSPPPAKETKAKKEKKTEVKEETKVEAPVEKEPEEEKAPEEKPAKKVRVLGKVTKYNRNLDLHKKLLSEVLDANHKGWRGNAAKAKDASIKLEEDEVDFLDAEGKVLQSFKDALKEAIG